MDKQEFIKWLTDNLPDNAIFDEPTFNMTRPVAVDHRLCGHDHDGFAVIKPSLYQYSGDINIHFRGDT